MFYFIDLHWAALSTSTYLVGLSWEYWLKLGDLLSPHLCLLDWYNVEKRVAIENQNAYPMPKKAERAKEKKKWWKSILAWLEATI